MSSAKVPGKFPEIIIFQYCGNLHVHGNDALQLELYRSRGCDDVNAFRRQRFLLQGLFRSNIHPFWWALNKSMFLSDGFHVVNHTFNAGSHPRSHNACDGRNAVRHEQSNHPLVLLNPLLRGSFQEFCIALLTYHVMIKNLQAKAKSASRQEM